MHSVGLMPSVNCLKFSSASLRNGFLLRRLHLGFLTIHLFISLFKSLFLCFFVAMRLLVSCLHMFLFNIRICVGGNSMSFRAWYCFSQAS